jgi:hypothetical protein
MSDMMSWDEYDAPVDEGSAATIDADLSDASLAESQAAWAGEDAYDQSTTADSYAYDAAVSEDLGYPQTAEADLYDSSYDTGVAADDLETSYDASQEASWDMNDASLVADDAGTDAYDTSDVAE